MPKYDKAELAREAARHGFVRDTFEKVLRLKEILVYFNENDYLKEHFALKGGTAINLTIFELPRLSVDIDMDYIPNDSREVMMENRKRATEIIRRFMAEEGYTESTESRFTHSLDAFYWKYVNSGGNSDTIKIELNYSLRVHVLETCDSEILPMIFKTKTRIRTLDPIEIFAAKANALMSRAAARDMYDFINMINREMFCESRNLFRKTIIYYATISSDAINMKFDTSEIDRMDFKKIRRDLFPVISKGDKASFKLEDYKTQCKVYISELMIVTQEERRYMDEFAKGRYAPELLFEDKRIVERIRLHPMALWKCQAMYNR